MLSYNTQLNKLALPEYGRNVQQMVDHCCTIEDRDERNKCARTIINIMSNLFPVQDNEEDVKHKLWDHLAIMSNFQLDVDYPFEIVKREDLTTKPEPIGYKLEHIRFRHYGKIIERMIDRAAQYPEGEERDALVMLIANHMKKLIYQISNEDVDDNKIFKDLALYSHGAINLDPASHPLHEFKIEKAPVATGKKKKKK